MIILLRALVWRLNVFLDTEITTKKVDSVEITFRLHLSGMLASLAWELVI